MKGEGEWLRNSHMSDSYAYALGRGADQVCIYRELEDGRCQLLLVTYGGWLAWLSVARNQYNKLLKPQVRALSQMSEFAATGHVTCGNVRVPECSHV